MKGRNPLKEAKVISRLKGSRQVVAAPRGHAKSTNFTFKDSLHAILYAYKHYILILSDSSEQAEGFLDDIKTELEDNANMIVNQANLHGLTVGYSTAFNKSFDTTQSNYQKVATVVPSTTGEQDYKWLGQMPGMREWIGEREVQALAAYDYLIKNKKFEMTIGVPRDDIEDDKYGVYTPLFSNMGEAAALHPDELVFGAMMSGFNEKCYDGLSFFNTAHKVGDATYSNRSNKKLSRESYMEGRSSIMSIKGDKGKSLKLVPDLLVVPPALEETARLILEADQIDGTTNVLKGTAKLHVEPALAEHPEYWFLLCTNRFLKPFIYQLRKKIKFTSLTRDTDENVFMLDEYLYGADGRSNAGYGFWQMAYGSTGEVEAQAQG